MKEREREREIQRERKQKGNEVILGCNFLRKVLKVSSS